VYVTGGTFHISNGRIYGNTASAGSALALYNHVSQRGTFNNDVFTSLGDLGTTNSDLVVANGALR